jgi:hypothetical protein
MLRILSLTLAISGIAGAVSAILMAALFGTGPLFRAFGLSLQTQDGQKARRALCALRGIVAWAPFLAALLLGARSIQTLTSPLLIVAFVGLVYAIAQPERGIPDLIAQTHIVPR